MLPRVGQISCHALLGRVQAGEGSGSGEITSGVPSGSASGFSGGMTSGSEPGSGQDLASALAQYPIPVELVE